MKKYNPNNFCIDKVLADIEKNGTKTKKTKKKKKDIKPVVIDIQL